MSVRGLSPTRRISHTPTPRFLRIRYPSRVQIPPTPSDTDRTTAAPNAERDTEPTVGIPTTREPSKTPHVVAREGAPDPASSQAMKDFKQFGPSHFIAVATCVGMIVLVTCMGRWLRASLGHGPGSRMFIRNGIYVDPAGRLLGIVGLMMWIAWQLWWMTPSRFEASQSLPLHICDIAGLIAPLALITGSRLLSTIIFFWGLCLCTQAYLFPVVDVGPLFTEYWIFWESHTLIIGSAVYIYAVRDYRPTKYDLRNIAIVSLIYLAIMLTIDIAMGWNYGYVGKSKPTSASPIDLLGPWPLRLVPLVLIPNLLFTILWVVFRDRKAQHASAVAG